MTAITSAATGDWDQTGTWTGGVVPVSGDTVTISSGHTVTVPVGYTAVCGTSPADNSGTVALTISGPFVINGTFKWQGPVRQGNATVTVGAGGTVTYDPSGAATPSTATYRWEMASASSQANAKIVCNGTSGSHCTFNSQGNTPGCRYGQNSTAWSDNGRFEATYTDFSYIGSSSVSAFASRLNTSVGRLILTNCTFDNCGQIEVLALGAAGVFQLLNTRITNPVNTSFTIQITYQAALSGGTREIKFCDIPGQVFVLGSGATDSGFTVKHNIGRPRVITGASAGTFAFSSGNTAAAWDQVLAYLPSNTNSTDPGVRIPAAACTNSYIIRVVNPSYSNAHPIYMSTRGGNLSATGWVLHHTGTDSASDWFQYSGADAVVARTLTLTNNVFLGNALGAVLGALYNNDSGQVQSNTVVTFDHNTIIGGGDTLVASGGGVFGVGAEAVAHCLPAGSIASIRSNIKYAATSQIGLIAQSPDTGGTPTADANAIAAADYQCIYNISTNIYAGHPTGQFAGTPGTNDIVADPQFVDAARSLLNFDQGYLGQAVATGWANATAYSVGDLVSASTSTFFNNATYNFRCVSAHTSATATDKPGSGSAWVERWEPAAVKLIADDLIAGTTYSGGANSIVGELVQWVKDGFAPQNATLANAGHDAVTIGAVEGDFGTDYTLACDSGTFTITGTDAGLEYGRIFSCEAGSYAITGTAASLEHGYKLVCASGSYLISGTDATLTEAGTFSLACDAGSFAVTGTAAGLRYSRRLACVAGAFTISGQNATLVYDGEAIPGASASWAYVMFSKNKGHVAFNQQGV